MESEIRKLKFKSGMTLIEVMIALGILMPSLAGLGAAMWKRQQATVKIRGVNQMVAIHSAFLQAVNSELSYTDAQIAGLKDGNWPAEGVTFSLISDTFPAAINFPVDTAGPTSLCINQEGATCACAGFGATCPVQIEAHVRTQAGGRFQFAYRVSAHESLGPMPPLGAPPKDGGGFDAAVAGHYSHYLPEKIYRFSVSRFCQGNNVALAGLVKSTGEEICLRAADGINAPEACPSGQIPKQFVSVGGVLTYRCVPLPTASCNDAHFVMQTFDPAVLDSGGGSKGQCRMVTQEMATYTPTLGAGLDTGSIVGEVCPPYYLTQSSCNLIVTKNISGECPTWNIEYLGDSSVAVAGGTEHYRVYGPVNAGTVIQPANPGVLTFSEGGRSVSCTLTIPPQRCGSIWEGRVELVPTCVLETGYQAPRPAQ